MQQADDISGDKRRSVLHFRAVAEHGNKKRRDGRVVVEDMLVLVKHFTKKYPQKQFRILEIGAGVGGVSIDLIEALEYIM